MARDDRFNEDLRLCPKSGGGVHSWIMGCANLAALAGVPQVEAEAAILRAMTRPPSPASEVAAALRKAYAEAGRAAAGPAWRPSKPNPLPMTRAAFIRRGEGVTEADWWERSPIRLSWELGRRDALEVLDALWRPDEFLFCGEPYGKTVLSVGEWIRSFAGGAPVPPHIVPNPVRRGGGVTKDGKPSFRCDDAVAAFRFAVVEFDDISKDEQLAFWWGFTSAPIAALIDSGGKSIHAWLAVNCRDREAWERDVESNLYAKVLVPLGCDPTCRNESRLSRLPGHWRREKSNWQRLLYLNPNAGKHESN